MIILPKGTKEVITLDITDKLGNIDTLDGAGGVFDVRMRGQDTWILQNEPITNLGMEAYCLIDTAPSQWKTTTYELFVKFNALPEQPRVGPVVFEIAYGTAADQPPPFDTSSPSGGSQLQTVTHTFTLNRAGGFIDSHVFDLGSDAAFPLLVKMTMLSFTADGETLGNDPGTLYVGGGADAMISTNSDNGVVFRPAVTPTGVNHFIVSAGDFVFELQDDSATPEAICLVARYVKIEPQLVANDTGATYAGANNPVASVQVDLTFRT